MDYHQATSREEVVPEVRQGSLVPAVPWVEAEEVDLVGEVLWVRFLQQLHPYLEEALAGACLLGVGDDLASSSPRRIQAIQAMEMADLYIWWGGEEGVGKET